MKKIYITGCSNIGKSTVIHVANKLPIETITFEDIKSNQIKISNHLDLLTNVNTSNQYTHKSKYHE